MTFLIHPAAAQEHKQQVAYYENEQPGLGKRYHEAFRVAVALACEMPHRPRVIHPPNIRSISLDIFLFNVIYREVTGVVQILAVAHHRRQPGYWHNRA